MLFLDFLHSILQNCFQGLRFLVVEVIICFYLQLVFDDT